MARDVGPEFKPHYCKKKKKEQLSLEREEGTRGKDMIWRKINVGFQVLLKSILSPIPYTNLLEGSQKKKGQQLKKKKKHYKNYNRQILPILTTRGAFVLTHPNGRRHRDTCSDMKSHQAIKHSSH
jgi:hypothetical protein